MFKPKLATFACSPDLPLTAARGGTQGGCAAHSMWRRAPLHTTPTENNAAPADERGADKPERKKRVDHECQQHRLARIEGYNITRARLQLQFANGIGDPVAFEKAIAEHLAIQPTTIAAWRRSEMEQVGFGEGVHLAALEFYWENREAMRVAILAHKAHLT